MAARAHARISVEGLAGVLFALESVGVEARTLKTAFREGSEILAHSLEKKAPKLTGTLAGTARAGHARSYASAIIGRTKTVPYAMWAGFGKKSPHKGFHYRALQDAKEPTVRAIERNLQDIIDQNGLG